MVRKLAGKDTQTQDAIIPFSFYQRRKQKKNFQRAKPNLITGRRIWALWKNSLYHQKNEFSKHLPSSILDLLWISMVYPFVKETLMFMAAMCLSLTILYSNILFLRYLEQEKLHPDTVYRLSWNPRLWAWILVG